MIESPLIYTATPVAHRIIHKSISELQKFMAWKYPNYVQNDIHLKYVADNFPLQWKAVKF